MSNKAKDFWLNFNIFLYFIDLYFMLE
jgi:hypothetical protein